MMALRSHVLSAFRFADYATGETTLARGIWDEVPENSLVDLRPELSCEEGPIHFETSGNRHWLSRTKVNTKWAISEKLGKDDYIVEWDVRKPGSIDVDAARDPLQEAGLSSRDAADVSARRREVSRRRTGRAVPRALGNRDRLRRDQDAPAGPPGGDPLQDAGRCAARTLGHRARLQPRRLEMERAAAEAGVPPTRISFVAPLHIDPSEFSWLGSPRVRSAPFPQASRGSAQRLKRLVLPNDEPSEAIRER